MYCKNCGNTMDPNAAVCVHCGFQKGTGSTFCQNCGKPLAAGVAFCTNCGAAAAAQPQCNPSAQKSKLAAGLLGVLLGGWGVHNFYLGYTGKAIAQIVLTFLSCGIGSLWGFIEGILILVGTINVDAQGVPLKDD